MGTKHSKSAKMTTQHTVDATGGDAALPFLEAFVAEARGGLVDELIREHGVEGKVVVAS